MILLELNFLSPTKKKGLRSLITFLFVKEYAEMIMLAICFLATLNITASLLLTATVNDLSNSTLLVNKDFSAYNQDIRTINKRITSVWQSGQQFSLLLPRINELSQALPPRVKLVSLVLDRNAGTVQLLGIAITRDDLLTYQQQLLELPWIASATLPDSQLFQKENVSFELTATVKDPVKLKPVRTPAAVAQSH